MGNFFKQIFGKKTSMSNFGDAIRSFKKRFGIIGEDLAKIPGTRIYLTESGDRIVVDGLKDNKFTVVKMLDMPQTTSVEKNISTWNANSGKIREITVFHDSEGSQRLIYEFTTIRKEGISNIPYIIETVGKGKISRQVFDYPIAAQGQFSALSRCCQKSGF